MTGWNGGRSNWRMQARCRICAKAWGCTGARSGPLPRLRGRTTHILQSPHQRTTRSRRISGQLAFCPAGPACVLPNGAQLASVGMETNRIKRRCRRKDRVAFAGLGSGSSAEKKPSGSTHYASWNAVARQWGAADLLSRFREFSSGRCPFSGRFSNDAANGMGPKAGILYRAAARRRISEFG